MNTKLIMTLSAILLIAIGIALSFAPDNVMNVLGINHSVIISLILQLLGAAYCAFAILNWMAKGSIIGGIYNRPIAIANLTHYLIGGLALIKAVISKQQLPVIFTIMAGCFVIFAILFGIIISRHPLKTVE